MNVNNMMETVRHKSERFLRRNSPTILTCIGAAGVVATAVLAVRATPKALKLIERENNERTMKEEEPVKGADVVTLTWRCYIPAAATGAATIACIFGANVLNRRQQASLASAYALVSRSFTEYKNKVRELYGQEAHEKIVSAIMAEKPQPPSIYGATSGKIFDFGVVDDQKRLFYDTLSDRYFESTFADVLLAELHINRNFAINGGEIGVQQFYDFLGLDTPEKLKPLAWFVCDYYYFIDFTHTRAAIDDGPNNETECWVIDMEYPPTIEPLDMETP